MKQPEYNLEQSKAEGNRMVFLLTRISTLEQTQAEVFFERMQEDDFQKVLNDLIPLMESRTTQLKSLLKNTRRKKNEVSE